MVKHKQFWREWKTACWTGMGT